MSGRWTAGIRERAEPGRRDQVRRDGRAGRGDGELLEVFRDLAAVGCDILTVGQYLRPSKDHLPMARLYTPESLRS